MLFGEYKLFVHSIHIYIPWTFIVMSKVYREKQCKYLVKYIRIRAIFN